MKYIITTDGKKHKVLEVKKICYIDIYYNEYVCEDGLFYEPQIVECIK